MNWKHLFAFTVAIGITVLSGAKNTRQVADKGAIAALENAGLDMPWRQSVSADFNCDGIPDKAFLGKRRERWTVAVVRGPVKPTSEVSNKDFKTTGNFDDSNRDPNPIMTVESLDYSTKDSLGSDPAGFKRSKTCNGIRLSAGETDPFHLYWNHEIDDIEWWRN